jgi:hypothetical protein
MAQNVDDIMVRIAAHDSGIVESHYANGGTLDAATAELREYFMERDAAAGVTFTRDVDGIARDLWRELAVIDYAADLGTEHGRNAAGWYGDGNTSPETWRAVLEGIESGDPVILDTLPQPDLSGQWADGLTGPQLVQDAILSAVDTDEDEAADAILERYDDAFTDICDAYEAAFSSAAEDEIARMARYQLAYAFLARHWRKRSRPDDRPTTFGPSPAHERRG